MARFTQSLGNRVRAPLRQGTGLDEIAIDDLAMSTKLQSWEAVQIPERLRLFSRLAVTLVLLFFVLIVFVPWTQTITVSGQLSAYTPSERPQDIEAQITGRIKKWHVFEGCRSSKAILFLSWMTTIPASCLRTSCLFWTNDARHWTKVVRRRSRAPSN